MAFLDTPLLYTLPRLTTYYQGELFKDIIALIVGSLLFFLLLYLISRQRRPKKASLKRRIKKGKNPVNIDQLPLKKPQKELLLELLRTHSQQHPEYYLRSPDKILQILNRGIKGAERNEYDEDSREIKKYRIYQIHQNLEKGAKGERLPYSTHALRPGIVMKIQGNSTLKGTVHLKENRKEGLLVQTRELNKPLKENATIPINVCFSNRKGDIQEFTSQITRGKRNLPKKYFYIDHSNTIHRKQRRKYTRRSIASFCYYSKARIVPGGTEKQRDVYLSMGRPLMGRLHDISLGGCLLSGDQSLALNAIIKLVFDIEKGRRVTTFGKVVGYGKNYHSMRIKFLRLTRRDSNHISHYIFASSMPIVEEQNYPLKSARQNSRRGQPTTAGRV